MLDTPENIEKHTGNLELTCKVKIYLKTNKCFIIITSQILTEKYIFVIIKFIFIKLSYTMLEDFDVFILMIDIFIIIF